MASFSFGRGSSANRIAALVSRGVRVSSASTVAVVVQKASAALTFVSLLHELTLLVLAFLKFCQLPHFLIQNSYILHLLNIRFNA